MEGELWEVLYRWIQAEASKRIRRKHVQFSDAWILGVFVWAVLHERPMCWACEAKNWPPAQRWRDLPSDSTLSDRLRTLSVLQLLASVLDRLAGLPSPPSPPPLVHVVDAKPLSVGGFSKDRDAKRGHAAAGLAAKGYKLFDVWADRPAPSAWTLGPMNQSEPEVARRELLGQLLDDHGDAAGVGGYLLGDSLYDTNPLHRACADRGLQLIAPRRKPQTGLGHQTHEPSRLRSIQLTETPAPGDLPASGAAPFGRSLYQLRGLIERRQGNLCSFGGGLAPLPAWVRRPRRVARWVAAKIIINGLRQCRKEGLTV